MFLSKDFITNPLRFDLQCNAFFFNAIQPQKKFMQKVGDRKKYHASTYPKKKYSL